VSEAPISVSKPKLAKSTVSTSSPFELPKFDLSKFEVPNVEVPAAFREILEKGVSQAKDLNEKVKAAAAEAAHVVEETYTTVAQGSAEYNRKAVEAALSNADTFFDYALAPLTAKSPTEIISGRDRADQGGFGARPKVGDRDRRAAQNRHHKRVEEGRLTLRCTSSARGLRTAAAGDPAKRAPKPRPELFTFHALALSVSRSSSTWFHRTLPSDARPRRAVRLAVGARD